LPDKTIRQRPKEATVATDRDEMQKSQSDNVQKLQEEVKGLEVAQATQAATLAGAQATQAAAHAGTWSTMLAGAAGLVMGIFLGIAIANSGSGRR
jgi:hypothetical protein